MSVEVIELGADFMEDFFKENPKFKGMDMSGWCECEQETDDFRFHDDGVTPWKTCVDKHHWHCGLCLKLNQIG